MVVLAFSPLITRIYSPEVFGLQGVFLSLVSILSPVAALRYPMAIVIAQDDEAASEIARLSLLIAFGISCLFSLMLAVGQHQVRWLLGAETLGGLIWFLPLALFCVALQDLAAFRAVRFSAFRLVGAATVTQAFLMNLARVLGGLITPTAGILVAVTSVAPSVQAFLLHIGLRKRMATARPKSHVEALTLLKRHRDFPLYRMPNDVLNAASQSVPVILLAALFSPVAAGLYTLARGVLNLPSNIIGNAIGDVLYSRFAELTRDGQALMPLLVRTTLALLAMAPAIVGLAWFAPPVFAIVFGEEWREAGHYARWMSIWIATMIVNVPVTRSLPVIGQQRLSLIFNILLLIVRVLSVLGVYWGFGSALVAVAWYSVSSTVILVLAIPLFGSCVYRFDQARKESLHH